MKPHELAAVELDRFSLTPRLDHEKLCVVLSGTGDLDAVPTLAAFLPKVHQQAALHGVEEVEFDFCALEFMNSSCFKAFVTFIDSAKTIGVSYRIRFITASKHYWQRRSLEALRRLAMGLVIIESDQES